VVDTEHRAELAFGAPGLGEIRLHFIARIRTTNHIILVLVVLLVPKNAWTGRDFEDEADDEDEKFGSWRDSIRFGACIGTTNRFQPAAADVRRLKSL